MHRLMWQSSSQWEYDIELIVLELSTIFRQIPLIDAFSSCAIFFLANMLSCLVHLICFHISRTHSLFVSALVILLKKCALCWHSQGSWLTIQMKNFQNAFCLKLSSIVSYVYGFLIPPVFLPSLFRKKTSASSWHFRRISVLKLWNHCFMCYSLAKSKATRRSVPCEGCCHSISQYHH